jgi:predicted  nucleic acid-binding Zn-ribbon protein
MTLTKVEREKITDGMLKIQSARASLEELDGSKVPKLEALEDCLEDADKNLKLALKQAPAEKKR